MDQLLSMQEPDCFCNKEYIKKGSIVSFYLVDCIGIENVLECEEGGVDGMTVTSIVRRQRRLPEVEDARQ